MRTRSLGLIPTLSRSGCPPAKPRGDATGSLLPGDRSVEPVRAGASAPTAERAGWDTVPPLNERPDAARPQDRLRWGRRITTAAAIPRKGGVIMSLLSLPSTRRPRLTASIALVATFAAVAVLGLPAAA